MIALNIPCSEIVDNQYSIFTFKNREDQPQAPITEPIQYITLQMAVLGYA